MNDDAPATVDLYEGIVCQNIEPDFDGLLRSQLKCYVYVLGGPGASDIFYVGKAGGQGAGNQRVLDHFDGAQAVIGSKGMRKPTDKEARIIETWRKGDAVKWSIVRRGLPSADAAFHVEAALIDVLGPTQLTNSRREWTEHGRLTVPELEDMAAPPLQASQHYDLVLMFNVKESVGRGASIYDATRMMWAMGAEFQTPGALAIGIVDGISYGVFEVIEWTLAPNERRKRQFTGTELIAHDLLKRNFSAVIEMGKNTWMRATPFGIELRPGEFRFRRGSADTKTWHPLLP